MALALIVNPKNEAVSFGIQRVENGDELIGAPNATTVRPTTTGETTNEDARLEALRTSG